MKKLIFKPLLVVILLTFLFVINSSSQSLVSFPYNLLQPLPGYTVPVDVYLTNADLPGTGEYSWTVSSTTGVSGLLPTSIDPEQRVIFSSEASGKYTFTISRGEMSVSYDIVVCNLLASIEGSYHGLGQLIGGFSINEGAINPETPDGYIFFDNRIDTLAAAIAVNQQGYIYYLPTILNQGDFYVIAASPNGDTVSIAAHFDMNGEDDSTSLSYVRLGIDAEGAGWILAADTGYTKIYLAKFSTNGTSNVSPVIVNDNVLFENSEGSVKDFANGDLAIDGDGMMIVLANNGAGNTVIFSLDTRSATPILKKRFQVNDNNNLPFTTQVNGVAFDIAGNVYISSYFTGLFFIPKSTVDNATGTVTASSVISIIGIVDLSSNYWPKESIVPLRLGNFSATLNNNIALLNWNTISEENLKYFEIERSYSGNDFKVIVQQKAIGNSSSNNNYNLSDNVDFSNQYAYYRIKAVDITGSFIYSQIVKLDLKNYLIAEIITYPNPFSTQLKVEISCKQSADINVQLFNSSGQYIFNKVISVIKGKNMLDLTNEIKNLSKGTYLLKIITENRSIFEKKILKN
ncbi:MAG: T9SS type A sorting domain-containing protein [Bacteroidota bacterium]